MYGPDVHDFLLRGETDPPRRKRDNPQRDQNNPSDGSCSHLDRLVLDFFHPPRSVRFRILRFRCFGRPNALALCRWTRIRARECFLQPRAPDRLVLFVPNGRTTLDASAAIMPSVEPIFCATSVSIVSCRFLVICLSSVPNPYANTHTRTPVVRLNPLPSR